MENSKNSLHHMEYEKQRNFGNNDVLHMLLISPVNPLCPNEFGTVNHSIQRGATGLQQVSGQDKLEEMSETEN